MHFKDDDYIRDLRSEICYVKPRKVLKPDAVPSLNLPTA